MVRNVVVMSLKAGEGARAPRGAPGGLMLSDFRDAKLYDIGEARHTGYDEKGLIALKDDAFLWVKYSGISD